jgi:hypothetical protein
MSLAVETVDQIQDAQGSVQDATKVFGRYCGVSSQTDDDPPAPSAQYRFVTSISAGVATKHPQAVKHLGDVLGAFIL